MIRSRNGTIPSFLVAVLLAGMVLAVYARVGDHPFVPFDDGQYVRENPVAAKGLTIEGAAWALAPFQSANWHPLTRLSQMADVSLFGLAAGWHHRVRVVYHLLNAELLFLVLWRIAGDCSRAGSWRRWYGFTRCTWSRWRGGLSASMC